MHLVDPFESFHPDITSCVCLLYYFQGHDSDSFSGNNSHPCEVDNENYVPDYCYRGGCVQFITSLPLFNLLFLQTVENRVVRNLERRKKKNKNGENTKFIDQYFKSCPQMLSAF